MSGPKILKHHILNSNFLLLFSWWTCFRHHRAAIHTSLRHTHTHLTALFPGLDFTEARDSERQWHQLGHMQVCKPLQTDNHASTPPLSFLQAGCPSCRPTNSVRALKTKKYGRLLKGCNTYESLSGYSSSDVVLQSSLLTLSKSSCTRQHST